MKEDADKIYKTFKETMSFLLWDIDWKQLTGIPGMTDKVASSLAEGAKCANMTQEESEQRLYDV